MEHCRLNGLADIFSEGDSVVIGLSGGADSMALTHFLKFDCESLHLHLTACHVNHSLRGEESDRDMEFVREACRRWEIPFFLKVADVARISEESGISEEECGRNIRYGFFEETAEEIEKTASGKVWIATAHTLSDNLETVLFHLARGTGLKGLCGIPPVRGRIVRPLLKASREEIERYCSECEIPFVTDSTNLSEDYSRNKIRRQVLPVLKELNPSLEQTAVRTIETLSEEEAFLRKLAQRGYDSVRTEKGLRIDSLRLEDPVIVKRILKLFLEQQELPVSCQNVNALMEMVKAGKGKRNLFKNRFAEVKAGFLEAVSQEERIPYFEESLSQGDYVSKTGKNYKIKTLETGTSQTFHKVYKNLFAIFLDCGKICGSITIRQKKDGDKIKLNHKRHTKSLKKLFQEAGIPPEERLKLFVIADEQGVIAVEGFGAAQRVCCDETTIACWEIVERT